MKRPIVIVLIGVIIGIFLGLYLEINITLFLLFIICIITIKLKNKKEKAKKVKEYEKYVKLALKSNLVLILSICITTSCIYVMILDKKYKNCYSNIEKVELIGIIVSNPQYKTYKNVYKIKVININENKKYSNTYLLLNIQNNNKIDLEYGDIIYAKGKFVKPDKSRNYKGFDYSKYLKTKKVYGTIEDVYNIKILSVNNGNPILRISNQIQKWIINKFKQILPNHTSSLIIGIFIGNKDYIKDDVINNFSKSNLLHILAVSGMHVGIIANFTMIMLLKTKMNINKIKIITIFLILLFMFITGLSASVVRAGMVLITTLISSVIYRKADFSVSICIALLIILVNNPFSIMDIGLILSFLATIGIVICFKFFKDIFSKLKFINKYDYIINTISLCFSAQIFIIPIMIINFNILSLTFFISNLLIGFLVPIIVIMGIISLIISKLVFNTMILNLLLETLLLTADISSKIPFSKIILKTPCIITIIIYYIILLYLIMIYKLKNKRKLRVTYKKILNFNLKMKEFIKKRIKKLLIIFLVLILLYKCVFYIVPKPLKLYFIDVGQGDSTLIVTPNNKKVLIDGGGSEFQESFNVGKSILLPYLLDRKINKIDYVIISHFDSDHVRSEY